MDVISSSRNTWSGTGSCPKTIEFCVDDMKALCAFLEEMGLKHQAGLKRFYIASNKNFLIES